MRLTKINALSPLLSKKKFLVSPAPIFWPSFDSEMGVKGVSFKGVYPSKGYETPWFGET